MCGNSFPVWVWNGLCSLCDCSASLTRSAMWRVCLTHVYNADPTEQMGVGYCIIYLLCSCVNPGGETDIWTFLSNAMLSPCLKTWLLPQSPLLLSITWNIWIRFRRSWLVKQKLSVEVVLMSMMKWAKEMPPLDGPGNSISAGNIRSEQPSAEIDVWMIGTLLHERNIGNVGSTSEVKDKIIFLYVGI